MMPKQALMKLEELHGFDDGGCQQNGSGYVLLCEQNVPRIKTSQLAAIQPIIIVVVVKNK